MNQSKEACPYHRGVLAGSDHGMYFDTGMCIDADDKRLPEDVRVLAEARKKVRESLQMKPSDTKPEILEPDELFIRGVETVLEEVELGITPKIAALKRIVVLNLEYRKSTIPDK